MQLKENELPEKSTKKRIGIIGFGHLGLKIVKFNLEIINILGQFLKVEIAKSEEFLLEKIWNRTEDVEEGVLALSELNSENLEGLDLVIEVKKY